MSDIGMLRLMEEQFSQHKLFLEMAKQPLYKNLAPRVGALGLMGYMGCGFHYAMEQRLGRLMVAFSIPEPPCMNNKDAWRDMRLSWSVNEVAFEELCKMVIDAERSAILLISEELARLLTEAK